MTSSSFNRRADESSGPSIRGYRLVEGAMQLLRDSFTTVGRLPFGVKGDSVIEPENNPVVLNLVLVCVEEYR